MGNESLQRAKVAKYDEFYTRLEDINEEIRNYENDFAGKVILCNCDDPKWSNFWKYFHFNFSKFGLKKLITTHYEHPNKPSYKIEYSGGDDGDIENGIVTPLAGNGDFRSKECMQLLDECDIVATNPPFSLFNEFIFSAVNHDKKFIIIGNINNLTNPQILKLFMDNRIWLGYRSVNRDMYFNVPDDRKKWLIENKKNGSAYKIIDGIVMGRLASACWFTNLDNKKRHENLTTGYCYFSTNPLKHATYKKYDNYNAINVDHVKEIPMDYYEKMGVPVTFLDKYNPQQFDIIGSSEELANPYIDATGKIRSGRFYINGKRMYERIIIKRKKDS